jgi:cytoskeletal protein RodZ
MPLALDKNQGVSARYARLGKGGTVSRTETKPNHWRIARLVPARQKGEPMKKVLVAFVPILLSFALIVPTFAQRQAPKITEKPPKMTEEPEARQKETKRTESAKGSKNQKKKDASIDERKGKNTARPPVGTEGPETRKAQKKDASAKPQKSKGVTGSGAGKEQKAP